MTYKPRSAIESLNKEVGGLIAASRFEEALPLAVQAHATASMDLSDTDEAYTSSLCHLIATYRGTGKYVEADQAIEKAIVSCSDAFVRKDYSRTIRLTYDLKDLAPPFLPMRLLLISLQRLQESEFHGHFQHLLIECLEATSAYPWDQALLLLALGLQGAESAITHAENDDQKCQVNYYMAANLVTKGELSQAQAYFKACLAIASECPERRLATAEAQEDRESPGPLSEEKDLSQISFPAPASNPPHIQGSLGSLDALSHSPNVIEMRIQLAGKAQESLTLYGQGRFHEAVAIAREVRESVRSLIGENHGDYATCCHNLGTMYRAMGLLTEADSTTREAIEIRRRVHGASHPLVAESLCQLGDIYRRLGNLAEAERLILEARELLIRVRGDKHPGYATALIDLAVVYRLQGKYVEAEPLYRQALEIYRTYYGESHPYFFQALNNLGDLLAEIGRFVEAESLLQQSLASRLRQLGDRHPHVAESLINLAALYNRMGKYGEIEQLLERGCEILRLSLGEQHPEYATALNNLGNYYVNRGEYHAAQRLLHQAKDIRLAAIGKRGDEYATTLNNLGVLYGSWGNYRAAVEYMDEASEVCRAAVGERHISFARCLVNQASALQELGSYIAAMKRLQRAGEILLDTLGENHPEYAAYLQNLAALCELIGDYPQAIAHASKSLEIRRGILGEGHPEVAASMSSLGVYLIRTGQVSSAERMLREAVAIQRVSLGEHSGEYIATLQSQAGLYQNLQDHESARRLLLNCLQLYNESTGGVHPRMGHCYTSLASICVDDGDYDQACRLFNQAADVWKAVVGEKHANYAGTLSAWAKVPFYQGDYRQAEELISRALDIWRETLGEKHATYASGLNSLAVIKKHVGDLEDAELLHRQAAGIRLENLGDWHPDYGESLINLGCCCAARGEDKEALRLFQQAAAIDDKMIGQVFSIGADHQRMRYLKSIRYRYHLYLSLVRRYFYNSPEIIRASFEMVFRRKALGAEALATQRDAILAGRHPGLKSKLQELTILRRQIAQKLLAGPESEDTNNFRQLVAQWEEEKQQLEAQLAREIPEMNLEEKFRAGNVREVSLLLPTGRVLIEYVRLSIADFHAEPVRGDRQWKPARYLAFVMHGEGQGNVQMVDLGDADSIDRMIGDFRAGITGEAEDPAGHGQDAGSFRAGSFLNDDPALALRAAVFDKLVPYLAGCRHLLLAPDGDLSRLPFEVLPQGDGRRVIDDYSISYLTCGRDVLRFGQKSSSQPAAPLVVADPDFDLQEEVPTASAQRLPQKEEQELFFRFLGEERGERNGRPHTSEQRHLKFNRLPGTRQEGERIAALLGVQPWLEAAALEGRLKAYRSPRILHVATHGYFFIKPPSDPNEEARNLGDQGFVEEGDRGRLDGKGLKNPLLRSGLALAGVNSWLKGGSLPVEAEDGLLTAEDVFGLDLLDTDLVVLSACETGLGEIHVGEGVFGLQRAFVMAGTKTLVMSLWKVPDLQTQELMGDFYSRILAGQGRADALRDAQLALKSKYPNPFYWGAFICQGNPGPLPPPVDPK